jgi:hypothetical protein
MVPMFMSQLWNLVPTIMVLSGLLIAIWWLRRDQAGVEAPPNARQMLGPMGLEAAIGGLLLLWLVPWGLIVVLPFMVGLSALSPAGRADWSEHKKARLTLIVCLIGMVVLAGFVPVAQPVAPEAWGEPLLKENPNAPIYPASQQYTWLMLPEEAGFEVEIVQSISMRLPYQYGTWGAPSTALDLASWFGMETDRMRQAIELLDQQTAGPTLDPDEISMININLPETHTFISTTKDVNEEVEVRVFELRSLLSTSEDGTRVGEVLCVAKASLGGELQLLVIVRPILHPGLSSDRFAESLVIEWLSSV